MHHHDDDTPQWSHVCALGASMMLILTTMVPAAQAFTIQSVEMGFPCVGITNDPPFLVIGDCPGGTTAANAAVDATNDLLGGRYPFMSGSGSFTDIEATAVGEDIRLTWSFNESAVDENVTAFHVERGLNPEDPETLEQIGTTGPNATSYVDEAAVRNGDLGWYVVIAHLENGTTLRSQPFTLNGIALKAS